MTVRMLVGAAFVRTAPHMRYPDVFEFIGWMLVGTTAVLLLVPWRTHHRFAQWAVPQATRRMPLLGIGALIAGVGLLLAVL